ncbi:MAG TPA: hypothetical protein VF062_09560 [Candidatus Limnocylindrales bacterium]
MLAHGGQVGVDDPLRRLAVEQYQPAHDHTGAAQQHNEEADRAADEPVPRSLAALPAGGGGLLGWLTRRLVGELLLGCLLLSWLLLGGLLLGGLLLSWLLQGWLLLGGLLLSWLLLGGLLLSWLLLGWLLLGWLLLSCLLLGGLLLGWLLRWLLGGLLRRLLIGLASGQPIGGLGRCRHGA